MNTMTTDALTVIRDDLFRKLKELGADLTGVVSVASLKNSPSEQIFPNMKDHTRDHFADEITTGLPHGQVFWEEDAESVLVFAVAHPKDQPRMFNVLELAGDLVFAFYKPERSFCLLCESSHKKPYTNFYVMRTF